MNIDNQIKEWAKITESQINEVSDVDVDWNDEELEKASDRRIGKQLDHENFVNRIDDDTQRDVLVALLHYAADLTYYTREHPSAREALNSIKVGRGWWEGIDKKTREDIVQTLQSTENYSNDRKNKEEIRQAREEN